MTTPKPSTPPDSALSKVRELISEYHRGWPVTADKDHINLGNLVAKIQALLDQPQDQSVSDEEIEEAMDAWGVLHF